MTGSEGQSDAVADGAIDIFGGPGLPYIEIPNVDYSNLLQVEINGIPLCVHLDNKGFAEISREVIEILADHLIERDSENRPSTRIGLEAIRGILKRTDPVTEEERSAFEAGQKLEIEKESARFGRDRKLADEARKWRESQETKPAT